MSNLGALLKIEIAKVFSSLSNKKSKSAFIALAVIVGIMGVAISSFYSFILVDAYIQLGESPASAIAFFAGTASTLILISAMNQARGIYIGEDYDMLSSLPLRKRDIVGAKVITLYLTELLFSALLLVPHAVILLILAHDALLFFLVLVLALALPIIPIAIGVLLALVTTLATARFRYANIIVTVVYTLFLAGFSLLSILTRNSSASSLTQSFGAIGGILKWLNPTFILFEMALTTNPLIAIAFGGINVLVLVGTILFLALCFDRLHDIVSSVSLKPSKADVTMANKNETRTLLSLEFKRLMGSKIYFANAVMGAIMAIVGSSIFLFTMKQAYDSSSAEAQAVMSVLIIPIFIVISSWILGMSSPACSAISIEGKHFWLIKSLPVDYRKYMRVKLLFPLILYVPASLIASTIAVIFCHESALDIVMAYLIPLSYVVLTTFMGLIINLRHYKLKWSNETEAVKNSIAVLIGLLLDLGIIIVFGTPLIVVPILTGKALYAYIATLAAAVIADVILYLWLRKNFDRKIESIEDF